MKRKSHMNWTWILMVIFLVLGIIDFRFAIAGLGCMAAPLYHAVKGRGRIHCSHYCPRGSILGKFLQNISLNNNTPSFLKAKRFKNIFSILMLVIFSISLYRAGWNFERISFSVFRFVVISSIVAVIMGIIYKPRSWCTICPMGHTTGLIKVNPKIKKASINKEKNLKEKQVA